MNVYFGTDHAGFKLKNTLIKFVSSLGYVVVDYGACVYDKNDDFTDFVAQVAATISKERNSRGIILGGSGQGEAMLANKFPNVRATVFYGGTDDIIRLSREHNDANILSLGARFLDEAKTKHVVEMWLALPFPHTKRHAHRIKKMNTIIERYCARNASNFVARHIVPAIMPSSRKEIQEKITLVRDHVKLVQLDLMDGSMSPPKTFPYEHEEVAKETLGIGWKLPYRGNIEYEIDLMVSDPESVIPSWIKAGATRFIIHPNSYERVSNILHAWHSKVEISLAVHINTNLARVYRLLDNRITTVQFMGIKTVGYQGSPFAEQVVQKIREFHASQPKVTITVDGGVSDTTAPKLFAAGANRLVSGSAIFGSHNPISAIDNFELIFFLSKQ